MAESKEQQPRNAAAGQRQKEYAKDQRQETARAFGKQGLTRKNEEFMFQLNKQLDAQGADPAKKPAMLEETLKALQEGQKTGQTARGLFGTPTQRAHALLHPEPTEQSQTQSSLKLMALDNGIMFFAIFTFMFGLMDWISPQSMKVAHNGNMGITSIILVAITGGILFGWIAKYMLPVKNEETGKYVKRPLWARIVTVVSGLVMWILIYILTAMMPNSVNPRLNQWFYLILGVAAFALDIWLRGRYHITSAFSPRRQQRQ